jgi:hypothetical protein
LLQCPYGNEHIITHDTLQDIDVAIVWKVEHMFKRRSLSFSLIAFNDKWIFLFTKDNFCTLMDIVIVATLALARDQGKGVARLRAHK